MMDDTRLDDVALDVLVSEAVRVDAPEGFAVRVRAALDSKRTSGAGLQSCAMWLRPALAVAAPEGLVGDRWGAHRSSKTADGSPNVETQLTLMSARVVDLVAAGDRERWALAGDQIYVDLDISEANLPAGTRLALGSSVIEVTPEPHTGCVKFASRFGNDAHRFVNTKPFRHLRLRGLNAKVIEPGTVSSGDTIRKL